jgi:Icc-related predicted phosphoesterase
MKFVAISDTHNKHKELPVLPEGDVLLHAGDFTSRGYGKEIQAFGEWLNEQPFEYKVLIAGNHDIMFQRDPLQAIELLKEACPDVIYLNQEAVVIDGIKIWGEPRQPAFGHGWAFNVDRRWIKSTCWDKVPEDTDILLTHGPPYGYGDKVERIFDDETDYHVGCQKQADLLFNSNISYTVCGHIHEAAGIYKTLNNAGGVVVNAAVVNLRYEMTNPPVVFEMEAK